MTDEAAKKLAEILQHNKDRVGKPSRSARPGNTVNVSLGGNNGLISAVAGTVIKGGQGVAVVKTPNGPVAIQGNPGGSLGVQTIINEIWEEEGGKDKPKRVTLLNLLLLIKADLYKIIHLDEVEEVEEEELVQNLKLLFNYDVEEILDRDVDFRIVLRSSYRHL